MPNTYKALARCERRLGMRDYYLRKVAEGKNKMSVINALRNKIVQRIFACVKNKTLYNRNGINFNNFSKG